MAPCKMRPFHVPASQRSPGSVIISSHSSSQSCFIVFLAKAHNVTVHFGSYQHAGWAAAPNKLKSPFHPRFESTAHWSNSSRPWRRSSNCSLTEPEHVSPNLSVKTILHIIPRAVNETANRSTRPGETSGELRVVWSASYVQTVRNISAVSPFHELHLQVFKWPRRHQGRTMSPATSSNLFWAASETLGKKVKREKYNFRSGGNVRFPMKWRCSESNNMFSLPLKHKWNINNLSREMWRCF